jgi:hypothetical protein
MTARIHAFCSARDRLVVKYQPAPARELLASCAAAHNIAVVRKNARKIFEDIYDALCSPKVPMPPRDWWFETCFETIEDRIIDAAGCIANCRRGALRRDMRTPSSRFVWEIAIYREDIEFAVRIYGCAIPPELLNVTTTTYIWGAVFDDV